jgi:hydrogenase maturation protein HypF
LSNTPGVERLKLWIRGAVQGVGFRPFVYRLAAELGLAGWVNNSASGVLVEVEGPPARLEEFRIRVERERPPRAVIQGIESSRLDPAGYERFDIRASEDGEATVLVLPDIATCPDCLADIGDPANRRYRYPFTNCTNCGPRFSIIEALPYDRPRTTMAGFEMCEACRAEYEDPRDRRFHAQPNACPACGPRLALWDRAGATLGVGDEALRDAAARVRGGETVAVKGLGGFHLVVDARNDEAVRRLRQAKARDEKPFALMFPSIDAIRSACVASPLEETLLSSPEAPIVLLDRRDHAERARRNASASERSASADPPVPGDGGPAWRICDAVAPGNPSLGVMLPYTPIHHLLLAELGFPIVATSGNLSDEPICTDNREALDRLGRLADVFLVHDRPIARHVDDSVVRVAVGRELVLRRARGYAPLPVALAGQPGNVLGVGPHLKNTVALGAGPNVFVSQHIGDLETTEAYGAFERVIASLEALYRRQPDVIACDAHPDYLSSRYARQSGRPRLEVQHHLAHVLACLAENEVEGPALGVAWDGTGFGTDGTIWGGEFFVVDGASVERVATFRPFALPGGDQAVREPRRSALGVLHAMRKAGALPHATNRDWPRGWEDAFDGHERTVLARMIERGINAPLTSSVGRLFDAVASLAGLRHRCRYEGQAAMELEYAAARHPGEAPYPLDVRRAADEDRVETRWVVDWGSMVRATLQDIEGNASVGEVAARFHHALVEAIVSVARLTGETRVALSGGCFQNRRLVERAVARLREEGFRPYWHQRIPPNDGGISLGQVVAAARGIGKRIG